MNGEDPMKQFCVHDAHLWKEVDGSVSGEELAIQFYV
jgi:hypothetical protein